MIYILLIVMSTSQWGQISHIEFNTKEACLAAAAAVQKNYAGYRLDSVHCIAKGAAK